MNPEFNQPAYLRQRRINELERMADDQREGLRLHAAGLAASVRSGELWREAAETLIGRATAKVGPLGGVLRMVVSRLFTRSPSPKGGKRKLPWGSALLAGLAAAGFATWWQGQARE